MNFIKRFFTTKTKPQKPAIIVEPRKDSFVLADFYSVPNGRHIGYCRHEKDWELNLFIGNKTTHPATGRYYSHLAMKNAIGKSFRFEDDKIDSLLPKEN
jgi:hypothetical protein